jgi:hypothetical protein
MSDPHGRLRITSTERKVMNTYEFHGTYIYIVQAESLDEAREMLNDDLGQVTYEHTIERESE